MNTHTGYTAGAFLASLAMLVGQAVVHAQPFDPAAETGPPDPAGAVAVSSPSNTVAVLQWMAIDPPGLPAADLHWLQTFKRLVSSELRHAGAGLRVLPEGAVARELARQKRDEAGNTDAVLGIRRLGENMGVRWVVLGGMVRTGATWTVQANTVEAASGAFGPRLIASSTNWFELRDRVVRHALTRLNAEPTARESQRMGRPWTGSARALEMWSHATVDDSTNSVKVVELLQQALALDPQFTQAKAVLASTLMNMGRDAEGLSLAQETFNLDPDPHLAGQLHRHCASALLRQKQEAKARQELAEGLRLLPDDADLLTLQSMLQEEVGDLKAAVDSVRQALAADRRDPALYARLGRLNSKQGDLTNALANLKLARQLLIGQEPQEQIAIEFAMAEACESVGRLGEALGHYRNFLAQARFLAVPSERFEWVEKRVTALEERSRPIAVAARPPREYTPAELQSVLLEKLSPKERGLAVNPVAFTPEMAAWAGRIAAGAEAGLPQARKLYDTMVARPRAAGGASRTAAEVFAAWDDLGQLFRCQEYAKLFVALSRSLGLPAFYVHVERDYSGRIVDHDCAVVFFGNQAWLVDPAYSWFGVPHREFRVLDDVQTVAHHAFQPHGEQPDVALCRAGCKLDPDFAWGRINLALALAQSGRGQEARQELDRARTQAPDYWRIYQVSGSMALGEARDAEALSLLRQADEKNPGNGNTLVLLGEACFRNGQYSAAREKLLAGLALEGLPGGPSAANEPMARETLALLDELLGPDPSRSAGLGRPPSAPAYFRLGLSYLSGPTPDYAAAVKYFQKAADMGSSEGHLALGVMYWMGQGLPDDPVAAVSCFRKAAEAGEPQAMRNLAVAYDRGRGIERDRAEAWRWLRRAAQAGDAESQTAVGTACYEGKDVPKNMVEALYWLTLAVEADSDGVAVKLGVTAAVTRSRARNFLQEVELFATLAEKAEASRKVQEYREKQAARAAEAAAPEPKRAGE